MRRGSDASSSIAGPVSTPSISARYVFSVIRVRTAARRESTRSDATETGVGIDDDDPTAAAAPGRSTAAPFPGVRLRSLDADALNWSDMPRGRLFFVGVVAGRAAGLLLKSRPPLDTLLP